MNKALSLALSAVIGAVLALCVVIGAVITQSAQDTDVIPRCEADDYNPNPDVPLCFIERWTDDGVIILNGHDEVVSVGEDDA